MPADPAARLEELHVVCAGEEVGGRHAARPAPTMATRSRRAAAPARPAARAAGRAGRRTPIAARPAAPFRASRRVIGAPASVQARGAGPPPGTGSRERVMRRTVAEPGAHQAVRAEARTCDQRRTPTVCSAPRAGPARLLTTSSRVLAVGLTFEPRRRGRTSSLTFDASERVAGVVAVSGGNHGIAVPSGGRHGRPGDGLDGALGPPRRRSHPRVASDLRLTEDMAGAFALLRSSWRRG